MKWLYGHTTVYMGLYMSGIHVQHDRREGVIVLVCLLLFSPLYLYISFTLLLPILHSISFLITHVFIFHSSSYQNFNNLNISVRINLIYVSAVKHVHVTANCYKAS